MDSDDEGCPGRAEFNVIAAVNHSMPNIAVTFVENENDVPSCLSGRTTESGIQQNQVDVDVPPVACVEITGKKVKRQDVKQFSPARKNCLRVYCAVVHLLRLKYNLLSL